MLDKEIQKSSNANSLILIFFLILVTLIVSATDAIVQKISDNEQISLLLMYFIQYIIIIPASIVLVKKMPIGKQIPSIKECFCKPVVSWIWIIKWIIISLFLIYTASFISTILFAVFQNITGVELYAFDISAENNTLSRLTNIVFMMILAPLFEELLFRGFLLQNVARHGGWSMIIATGISFGLWHANYVQILFASVLGICAGFLTNKTRSIYPAIILHFCLNLMGTISSLFTNSLDPYRVMEADINYIVDNFLPIIATAAVGFLIIVIMISGFVLVICEIITHIKKSNTCNHEGDTNLELKKVEFKKLYSYFSAPITIAFVVIYLLFTCYNAIS